jgi:hypothetical protein
MSIQLEIYPFADNVNDGRIFDLLEIVELISGGSLHDPS